MIYICLCDDDTLFLEKGKNFVNKIGKEAGKELFVECFPSGESLIFNLDENINKFNIIILDMIMKETNGIETVKKLREKGYKGEIIFLSSSKEYAIDSFEVEPLYYVLKGASNEQKFREVLLKAINQVEKSSSKKILITTKKRDTVIESDEIAYIECVNKKVRIYKVSKEIEEVTNTLGSIEDKIKKLGFIRCHKSYIVNAKYVESFTKTECRLKDKILIPIGRKYTNSFQDELLQYELDNVVI